MTTRISLWLAALPFLALLAADITRCPPLDLPTGTHPATKTTIPAGRFEISVADGEILARPVCYSDQGWVLTTTELHELRCTYDLAADLWSWNQRAGLQKTPLLNRRAGYQVQCSHISAKPITQRFTLRNFDGCSDPVEAEAFVGWFKPKVESVLPCVLEGRCVVDYVSCEMGGGEEQATLAIKINSVALESLEGQTYFMVAAKDILANLGRDFFSEKDDAEERSERRRRQIFDPDIEPDTTDFTGCDPGHIEEQGGCLACVPGTFANTTSTNETCSPCPLDEYSEVAAAVECTACNGSGIGTLEIGSYSPADCVVVCEVPEIGRAVYTEPEAGDRVENLGYVTVHCDNDYAYNGSTTAPVMCSIDSDNNGFLASCQLICEAGFVEKNETCVADESGDDCWWKFAYGECERGGGGCHRDVFKYCECSGGEECAEETVQYEVECYSCWEVSGCLGQSVVLVVAVACIAVWNF